MFAFDIPETQLIGVMILGFFLGAVAFPYFLRRPLGFLLINGTMFFLLRYAIAIFEARPQQPGTAIGNGIITAWLMWLIYIGMMFVGDYVVRRRHMESAEYYKGP